MKKHVLLCVIGTSPQIITETIYALAKRKVFIDELYVITTVEGKRRVVDKLIKEGILKELISDYGLKPIDFGESNIYLIKNSRNMPLSDIRSASDNESAGDVICSFVQRLTEREDVILHCSLAGGRKTMGFYLGTALQLYGRKEDKLYHVLVNEEFEGHPDFFYPPKKPKEIVLKSKDGTVTKKSTKEAKIELAELPFLRLRGFIDLQGKSFRELIESTQSMLDLLRKIPYLSFSAEDYSIKVGNVKLKLSYNLWELYLTLALLKKKRCSHPERFFCNDCKDCFIPIKGENSLMNLTKQREEDLRSKISKLNALLGKNLSEFYETDIVNNFLISSHGSYGKRRYGLLVEKTKIIREEN